MKNFVILFSVLFVQAAFAETTTITLKQDMNLEKTVQPHQFSSQKIVCVNSQGEVLQADACSRPDHQRKCRLVVYNFVNRAGEVTSLPAGTKFTLKEKPVIDAYPNRSAKIFPDYTSYLQMRSNMDGAEISNPNLMIECTQLGTYRFSVDEARKILGNYVEIN